MSDVIPISETPIFKQLAEEYASRGKRYESLTEGAPVVIREEKLSTSLPAAEALRKQLELYQAILPKQEDLPWSGEKVGDWFEGTKKAMRSFPGIIRSTPPNWEEIPEPQEGMTLKPFINIPESSVNRDAIQGLIQNYVDRARGNEKLEEGNLMTERKVSITESFDPYEMFEAGVNTDVFVKGVVQTFMEKYPAARNVVAFMTYPEGFSTTHTVKVEGFVSVEQAEYVEPQTGDQTKE